MSVVNMVVGATTPDGATFVAKVDGGGPVRIRVADNAGMSSPTVFGPQSVDAQGVAKVSATGLQPNTRYWWRVQDGGTVDNSVTGQLITHPPLGQPASFTIATASCAGGNPHFPGSGSELAPQRVSNHPVFETIRSRGVDSNWLGFMHLGDLHYYDLGSGAFGITDGGTLENYRRAYDDVFAQSNQAALYRELPWMYAWDDHDYGPNNSDKTHVDKENAAAVFRERVPHYPLSDEFGIWQSWQIGRIQFIAIDSRFYRDPGSDEPSPEKTLLGTAQKAWFKSVLESSTALFLVFFTTSHWSAPSADTWSEHEHERDELIQMFTDTGWRNRMAIVFGDRHGVGISSGATSPGNVPMLLAASLDSSFSEQVRPEFDIVPDTGGRNQYGTIEVNDDGGPVLSVTLSAWHGTTLMGSFTTGVSTGAFSLILPGTVSDSISGSHRPVFEARVLTNFQTGPDPEGTTIPIMNGDVMFDGSSGADVFASVDIETIGVDESTGKSLFPRNDRDLLSPYGNEIFVRSGIDFGEETLWFPLGYFRIENVEQDKDPDHPIRISGRDRMSGIIDGRLVEATQFDEEKTVLSVVSDLVRGIYPNAAILFDDVSGTSKIGRQLVVEESRIAALVDVADALGKVVYWDGEGFLRFEDPPSPDNIKWIMKAGFRGVLAEATRKVSREGMANGVVAVGEGTTAQSVRGVAFDNGPNSPTQWGGRFGKVPFFYSSPLLTTNLQARKAARSLLLDRIGRPYSVNFGVIQNPTIRPRDAVYIMQKDGEREKHIIETCTVPLVAEHGMTGTTRELTKVHIEEI